MSEMKPTPGPWAVDETQPDDAYRYVLHGKCDSFGYICRISINGNANAESDARLIAEAGTVHHETGLTPRQLVERVKEMEEALLEARSVLSSVCTSRHRRVVEDGVVLYTQTEDWCRWAEGEVLDKVRAALSKSLPNTVAETPSGQAPAGAAITPEQLKELLGTPEKVHLNMLHGHLATITMEQCAHLHGEATQRKWAAALAQKEQSP